MGLAISLIFVAIIPISLIFLLVWMRKRRKKKEALLVSEGIPLLPVWATVTEAYKLAWHYKIEYFKIAWCWLVLGTAALFLINFLFTQSVCAYTQSIDINFYQESLILPKIHQIIVLFFSASIAVAWHRLILLNERVTANTYLRFDKVVWKYFLTGICLLLINYLALIVTAVISIALNLPTALISILILLFGLASILYTIRLSVLLPAKALNISEITIKEVSRRTKGNDGRLFMGIILCSLIVIPYFLLLAFINTTINANGPLDICSHNAYVAVMHSFVVTIMLIIATPINLSFLSLAYQFFFEQDKYPLCPTSKPSLQQ